MDTERDLKFAIGWVRFTVNLVGLWPNPDVPSGTNWKFLAAITFLFCFMIAPQAIMLCLFVKDVTRFTQIVASMIMGSIGFCKLVVTWHHNEDLRVVTTAIFNDWASQKKDWEYQLLKETAKASRLLTFRCFLVMSFTAVAYTSIHIITFVKHLGKTKRYLIYAAFYPFDVQQSPFYETLFFCQLISGFYSGLIYSTIDSFISTLMLHVAGQFVTLRHLIKRIVAEVTSNASNSLSIKQHLRSVIQRHHHLNELATIINNSYSVLLFTQLLAATFQLCFEVFQAHTILTDKQSQLVGLKLVFLSLYAVLITVHLYAYCYAGERIRTESSDIGYGVYESEWYNLPAKEAKSLMFIVYRSLTPLHLTAGKFGTFTIQLFGATVKASMGYLSVLLTVQGEE